MFSHLGQVLGSLFLSLFLLNSFLCLRRVPSEKAQINHLFRPRDRIVPMELVKVVHPKSPKELSQKQKMALFIRKNFRSRIEKKKRQRAHQILGLLDKLYGISKDTLSLKPIREFDDQTAFFRKHYKIPRALLKFISQKVVPQTCHSTQNIWELFSLSHAKETETPNPHFEASVPMSPDELDLSATRLETNRSALPTTDRENPSLRPVVTRPEGVCVANAASLSQKEYLKQFAKSKCSPITITPGIFSSKLVVQINCRQLRSRNPELFRVCGWTDCSNNLLGQTPKQEYVLWIPDLLDSLNVLTLNQEKNNCWVRFFSTPMNPDALRERDLDNLFRDTWSEGWRVRIFGDTQASRENRQCGSSAIEYLLPYDISADNMRGSKGLMDGLRLMGYRDGVSMQAIPYDFRKASGLNRGFKDSFIRSLKRIKRLTGKRSIVLAHSFGTVNTYSAILGLSEADKRDLIEFWAPVGAPLMGNTEMMGRMVSGENPLSLLNGLIGLTKQQTRESFYLSTFTFELLPFNYWQFVDKPWFRSFVLTRLLAESSKDSTDISRPTFFPVPRNECLKKLPGSGVKCIYLKSLFPGKKIIQMRDKSYVLSQMDTFLEDLTYSFGSRKGLDLKDIYEVSRGDYREYPNPGVPVVGFFYNSKPTIAEVEFDEKELDYNRNQEPQRIVYNSGDGTVETYSVILPMLKWAYEFSHEPEANRFPIKFVELCSRINRKPHPFDSSEYLGNFRINNYMGSRQRINSRHWMQLLQE